MKVGVKSDIVIWAIDNLNKDLTTDDIVSLGASYYRVGSHSLAMVDRDIVVRIVDAYVSRSRCVACPELLYLCNRLYTTNKPDLSYGLSFPYGTLESNPYHSTKIPAIKAYRELLKSDYFKELFPTFLVDYSLANVKYLVENGIIVGPLSREKAEKLRSYVIDSSTYGLLTEVVKIDDTVVTLLQDQKNRK